ncbi:hypothetical protein [Flavobacterium sp.]|uniref:hypothetical protein n=1 Tax=Flavobacterium sp. TaxID=239 RepID=UPI0031D1053B
MKGILLIIVLLFSYQVQSQNDGDGEIDNSISTQFHTKCLEDLTQGNEMFEKYPNLKTMKFCSILECTSLLAYKEKDAKLWAEQRLIEIATKLFNQGTPVFLNSGMDSYLSAEQKNINLEDDNHILYISYGGCSSPSYFHDAADIINRQTAFLIDQATK